MIGKRRNDYEYKGNEINGVYLNNASSGFFVCVGC